MKFKDFQAPVLFSSTLKALNLGKKIQVLSSTFKDAWEPCQNKTSKSKKDKNDLKAAILPASGEHLNKWRFVFNLSNEVRQQNAMQSSKQTPALLRLGLITSILLTVTIQHIHNQIP